MAKRIVSTSKLARRVKSTSSIARKVDPELVRRALGAEHTGDVASTKSSPALAALRRELVLSLRSSGGRPALDGAVRRQKIPMADADWAALEQIAEALRLDGVSATAGQVAGQLLRDAIAKVQRIDTTYPERRDGGSTVSVAENVTPGLLPSLHGIGQELEALRGDVARANARLDRSEEMIQEIKRRERDR